MLKNHQAIPNHTLDQIPRQGEVKWNTLVCQPPRRLTFFFTTFWLYHQWFRRHLLNTWNRPNLVLLRVLLLWKPSESKNVDSCGRGRPLAHSFHHWAFMAMAPKPLSAGILVLGFRSSCPAPWTASPPKQISKLQEILHLFWTKTIWGQNHHLWVTNHHLSRSKPTLLGHLWAKNHHSKPSYLSQNMPKPWVLGPKNHHITSCWGKLLPIWAFWPGWALMAWRTPRVWVRSHSSVDRWAVSKNLWTFWIWRGWPKFHGFSSFVPRVLICFDDFYQFPVTMLVSDFKVRQDGGVMRVDLVGSKRPRVQAPVDPMDYVPSTQQKPIAKQIIRWFSDTNPEEQRGLILTSPICSNHAKSPVEPPLEPPGLRTTGLNELQHRSMPQ